MRECGPPHHALGALQTATIVDGQRLVLSPEDRYRVVSGDVLAFGSLTATVTFGVPRAEPAGTQVPQLRHGPWGHSPWGTGVAARTLWLPQP